MGTPVPDRNCRCETGRGRSSWQLFDKKALSGLRELSDVSAHGIEIASAMPASLYILKSIWMTKSIARLTLAVLALVLMGRQWTYANPDVDPAKHKRVPEPATLTLIAVGFAGVGAIRRRRKVS